MEGSNYIQDHGRTLVRILPHGFSSIVRFLICRDFVVSRLIIFLASFFLKVLRIGSPEYLPDVDDVLRARQKSVGITETRFTMGQLS